MSLGNTLRAAREACGITTSELAARTHMLVQIVEGLENEDFRRIPAPIYGRGFIKLYCEAVNIDPKPLQAEFMELFNRPKDAAANAEPPPRRPAPPPVSAPEPPPPLADAEPPPVPAPEPPQTDAEPPRSSIAEFGELFAQPAQPAAQPPKLAPIRRPAGQTLPTPPQPSPQPKRSYGDIFGQAYSTEEETPKQSAAEKFRNTMSNVSSGVFSNVQKLPPNIGRIVTVSLCVVLTAVLIGWGVFALYRATSPADGAPVENSDSAAEKTQEARPDEKKSEKNTAKKIVAESAKTKSANPVSRTARSVNPGDLRSSGIEVPALYID